MNRRSFISGIIAACAGPNLIIPVLQDRQIWKRSTRILTIAELQRLINESYIDLHYRHAFDYYPWFSYGVITNSKDFPILFKRK